MDGRIWAERKLRYGLDYSNKGISSLQRARKKG